MIKSRKRKKGKKNKKYNNSPNNLLSALTFSSLLVILFVFHLFLYKQIEGLNIEKGNIKNKIKKMEDGKNDYHDRYNQLFNQNEESIANNFYGYNRWKRQSVVKKHIILDK